MRIPRMLAAAAVLATAGVAVPSHAAASATVCTFTTDVAISPGTGIMFDQGTFTTTAPGTITCQGTINGTGTITYSGNTGTIFGENCALDLQGTGTLEYIIGNTDITGSFTFTRLAAGGAFNATTTLGTMLGTFEFQPVQGDCVTAPVTEATVTGQAVLPY